MEFKGTKGKWRVVKPEGYGKDTLIMFGTDIIASMVKFENKQANALLISKAPEMLEMLIKMKDAMLELMEHQDGWENDYDEILKLIKEATEL